MYPISRRRMLKRIGAAGVIAWATPILTSVRAPAFAASPFVDPSGIWETGSINDQLVASFTKYGRPDLAAMVGTDDWNTWIGMESGGNPYVTAPNGAAGYFQFLGHPWEQQYIRAYGSPAGFTMPLDMQVQMVVTHFNLSPDRIQQFAEQIRSGRYLGWG